MRLILLDTNMPHGMRSLLPGCDVRTAHQMGWDRLANGNLLTAAESSGFAGMISADRNIQVVVAAIPAMTEGSYATATLPLPPKVRRPYLPPK